MEEEAKLACGCVPGEVCCQEATDASRRLRDVLPNALKDGDWDEFDRLRAWLAEHHFHRRESRDTGEFTVVKRATRA